MLHRHLSGERARRCQRTGGEPRFAERQDGNDRGVAATGGVGCALRRGGRKGTESDVNVFYFLIGRIENT